LILSLIICNWRSISNLWS